jgi:hypothetical protein
MSLRVGVFAVDDTALGVLTGALEFHDVDVVRRATIEDEEPAIARHLAAWLAEEKLDIIVSTGTANARAALVPLITRRMLAFSELREVDGGRCGKTVVVLVPRGAAAASSALEDALPRIESELASAQKASAPPKVVIPPKAPPSRPTPPPTPPPRPRTPPAGVPVTPTPTPATTLELDAEAIVAEAVAEPPKRESQPALPLPQTSSIFSSVMSPRPPTDPPVAAPEPIIPSIPNTPPMPMVVRPPAKPVEPAPAPAPEPVVEPPSVAVEPLAPVVAELAPLAPRQTSATKYIAIAAGVLVAGGIALFAIGRSKPSTSKASSPPPAVAVVTPDAAIAEAPVDASTDFEEIEVDKPAPKTKPAKSNPSHASAVTTPPPSTTTAPAKTKTTAPAKVEAVAADGCDKVSCVLDNFARPCCEPFRPRKADEDPYALDKQMITTAMGKVKAAVIRCGEQHANAKGIVKIATKVAGNGHVTEATVADAPDPALGECVAGVVRKASFATTVTGGTFTYPFKF